MNRRYSFGYGIIDGEFNVIREEADIVKEIFVEYANGKTLKNIAEKRLQDKTAYYNGVCNWNKNNVLRIIKNEKYIGGDNYPPIVSVELFNKVKELYNRKSSPRPQLPKGVKELREKVYCGQCGKLMGRRSKWDAREKWVCNNGCKTDKYVADKDVINGVLGIIKKVKSNSDSIFANVVNDNYEDTQEIIKYNNEIKRITSSKDFSFNVVKKLVLERVNLKFQNYKENLGLHYTDYVLEKTKAIDDEDTIDEKYINDTVKKITIEKSGDIVVTFINGISVSSSMENKDNAEAKSCN